MSKAKRTPAVEVNTSPAQADAAAIHANVPVAPVPEVIASPVEPLDDFLRRVEGVHIDRDVYAVEVTHPEATERVWPGTYSGIRLSAGPLSVRYSDGNKE